MFEIDLDSFIFNSKNNADDYGCVFVQSCLNPVNVENYLIEDENN